MTIAMLPHSITGFKWCGIADAEHDQDHDQDHDYAADCRISADLDLMSCTVMLSLIHGAAVEMCICCCRCKSGVAEHDKNQDHD